MKRFSGRRIFKKHASSLTACRISKIYFAMYLSKNVTDFSLTSAGIRKRPPFYSIISARHMYSAGSSASLITIYSMSASSWPMRFKNTPRFSTINACLVCSSVCNFNSKSKIFTNWLPSAHTKFNTSLLYTKRSTFSPPFYKIYPLYMRRYGVK